MDEDVTHTQIGSLVFIGLFLAVFLPLIFRSLNLGLVGLAINLLPLCVALGTMALFGIKINMATALVGGMSLGVVVDDTIHLLSAIMRSKQGLRHTNICRFSPRFGWPEYRQNDCNSGGGFLLYGNVFLFTDSAFWYFYRSINCACTDI